MQRPKILRAFTEAEFAKAHDLLAAKVAFMMGRKFEEGDWSQVYCAAKNIPNAGWSNLNIDVTYDCIGVEHKMLRPSGDKPVRSVFGTRLMHPSATRSIRIEDGDPNEVMHSVLTQYADFIEQRREFVRQRCADGMSDLRTGWVLWQSNLKEFVYFEEEVITPSPDDFIAEWHVNEVKGARKESKSLWVYEKETKQKKYSITTSAGAKIQPYFDVPPQSDPSVYFFKVQGEEIHPGLIRVWVPSATARELEAIVGGLTAEKLHALISKSETVLRETRESYGSNLEEAVAISVTTDSYQALEDLFPNAVSDSHRIQLLVAALSK